MRYQIVHDLVYPSACVGEINPLGVLYDSFSSAQKDQFVSHHKMVFLSNVDRAEIQRCASNGLPVLVQPFSLQNAFDLFKLRGVKMVLVVLRGSVPIIDFGWMQKACEENKTVVFSLVEIQKAFKQKDTGALQEYRKLSHLLQKSSVSLGVASFAREEKERLSEEDVLACAGFLGIKKASVQWFL